MGQGILRDVLREATTRGVAIDNVETGMIAPRQPSTSQDEPSGARMVRVTLQVHGKQPVNDLAVSLSELENVQAVLARDVNSAGE